MGFYPFKWRCGTYTVLVLHMKIENGPRTRVAIALPLNLLALNNAGSSTGQSLANRLTRDQKIVIHGNECIIFFLTRYIMSWSHNPAKQSSIAQFATVTKDDPFCDVTTVDLWRHANAAHWHCDSIFVDCSRTRKLVQRRYSPVNINREYRSFTTRVYEYKIILVLCMHISIQMDKYAYHNDHASVSYGMHMVCQSCLIDPWEMWKWFTGAISERTLPIKFTNTSYEIAPRWMPQTTFDDTSTMVQVKTWWRQLFN